MQITFAQYFKYFNLWQAPVYWVSGDGDGRLDIEQRLLKAIQDSSQRIVRVTLKAKADLASLDQYSMSQDLFDKPPLVIMHVAGSLSLGVIDWLNSKSFNTDQKFLIFSPKLSPKLKQHAIWKESWVMHYALWPLSIQQVTQWWQQHCQALKVRPNATVTQHVLMQTGGRIDDLRQIAAVWQLQFPEGGDIDEIPPGLPRLSERVYDEVYAWFAGKPIHSNFDVLEHMPFYFAVKQTLDEIIQLKYWQSKHLPYNEIVRRLKWWPQKMKSIMAIAESHSQRDWIERAWEISAIDSARVGMSPHSFEQLMNCFYRRQRLPLL